MEDNKKGVGILILSIIFLLVLINPILSPSNSITGSTVVNNVSNSITSVLTSIPPNFFVLTLLTVGLIFAVSEIQTRQKKKR